MAAAGLGAAGAAAGMETIDVEVFVDPSCPWAWITSRWLVEVAPARDLSLTWRSYCLEIRDDYGVAATMPEEYRERALAGHALSHRMLRLFEAARARGGEGAVDALYTEWGRRYFLGDGGGGAGGSGGRRRAAMRSWPGASPGAASARIFLGRRTTRSGTRRSSMPWRSPTSTEGPRPRRLRSSCGRSTPYGFKGPVMAPAPQGEAAIRLWDAITVIAQEPGFFEITRPRANPPRPTPID